MECRRIRKTYRTAANGENYARPPRGDFPAETRKDVHVCRKLSASLRTNIYDVLQGAVYVAATPCAVYIGNV